MRRARVPLGILLPIALLVLVGTLAALQYRWIGTVSEAERDELRLSLDRRAVEFAREFDREITRVYSAFQAAADRVNPDDPATFAEKFHEWRSAAPFPGLVSGVYYAKSAEKDQDPVLLRFDAHAREFRATDWPESFDAVRRHIGGTAPRLTTPTAQPGTQFVALVGVALLNDIPALILPAHLHPPANADAREKIMIEAAARRATEAAMLPPGSAPRVEAFGLRVDRSFVIVALDATVIREKMLPAVASRHFPDSERYRVAIVDGTSTPVLTRNLEGQTIAPADADVVEPFFRLRPELLLETSRAWTMYGPGAGSGVTIRSAPLDHFSVVMERSVAGSTTTTTTTNLKAAVRPAGWRVMMQHAAGSLEAAVTQVRVRNLWLSFGILAALAVSVGLIVFNARRSEKLAAQQMDFVATVSHELRTPLAVIRSAAQNLSAGVVHEPEQARRYGDLIENEGKRLTDMVEQVLEFAGLSGNRGPRLAPVADIGGLVKDAVASCDALFAAQGFSVQVDVANDLPTVLADEDAMRRALNNLLSNALKYGADGRWINVVARRAIGKGRDEVQISVSDRGLGIESQDLAHLFEPFYRGRRAVERQIHGNGLGLSLVKRIVESHGGRITVKSAPGAGATFVLHLPAAPPERLSTLAAPATESGSTA